MEIKVTRLEVNTPEAFALAMELRAQIEQRKRVLGAAGAESFEGVIMTDDGPVSIGEDD
jgi:hypothetical protein